MGNLSEVSGSVKHWLGSSLKTLIWAHTSGLLLLGPKLSGKKSESTAIVNFMVEET